MCKCCNGKVSGMDQDQIQNEEILEQCNQLSRHCSSSAWLSESLTKAKIMFLVYLMHMSCMFYQSSTSSFDCSLST
ncbi:hypothetical protein ACOSQ4_022764 [Xanthoceras sorbifolium]